MDKNEEKSAKILQKIIFDIPMQTYSPLRISSGISDGITNILILKDKNGKAFIPGTSIAGVLRTKMSSIYGERAVDKLFGRIDKNVDNNNDENVINIEDSSDDNINQSMINISDIVLKNAYIINRDGVKIDPFTGVSEQGAKFDFELIDRGAIGNLIIEVTIRKKALQIEYKPNINYTKAHKALNFAKNGAVYEEMLATLADILTDGVSVGALTTKGYGKIKSAEPVKMYVFDFTESQGAINWWKYLDKKELPKPLYTAKSNITVDNKDDLIMQMDFALTSSLIIRDYDEIEENNIGAVQLKSREDYVIPATSIKGVLKLRAYKILMNLNHHNEQEAENFLDKLMGRKTDKNDKEDKGQKSRLYIDEVYIKPNILRSRKHSRNRIDRFTGGTIDSALFTDKPIWQCDKTQNTICIKLRVQDCSEKEAGLMLLLMKDLWLGNLTIGGNKAIGRGVLKGKKCVIKYADDNFFIQDDNKFSVSDNVDKLESYVQKLSGE